MPATRVPPSRKSGALSRVGETVYLIVASQLERRVPWLPPERIERTARHRVRAMVEYAYAEVPFYRRVLRERGLTPGDFTKARDLERLPLIDGAMLAANPDDFTADRYRHQGREVFNTSGSTSGVRKRICWDHASLMRRFARGERDRSVVLRLAGESWGGAMLRESLTSPRTRMIARLLGFDSEKHQRLQILPADFSSRTLRAIGGERSLIPRRPLHYHHLSPMAPFAVAAAQIRAIKPRIAYSFGSYAEQFLRYVADRGAEVPMPRVWIYIGEMISERARELAAERGCRLYSVYGTAEAGGVGFQCERGEGFHLNVDLCATRVIGEDGSALPPGQSGEIVISPLINRATVLLNYRIGDRGVMAEKPCPCGRSLPLLAHLEGRWSETIHLGDGRMVSSMLLEGLFKAELRRTVQAQIEELEPGKLRWHIVPFASADREELRRAFAARAAQTLGDGTTLSVQFTEEIPRTGQGKFRRAVRGQGAAGH